MESESGVEPRNELSVVLFGASGVAGSGVLRICLAERSIGKVVAPVRRPLDVDHPHLRQVPITDFSDLAGFEAELENIDLVFYCLGKAVSQVPGGEAAYRELTMAYAMAAARATKRRSPNAVFHFLSGSGTNASSRMMWARVKGETENALATLELGGLVCWRPAMIMAPRTPPGLPMSYRIAYPVMRALAFMPTLSVSSDDLGRAMVHSALDDRRSGVVENREIRQAADAYRKR